MGKTFFHDFIFPSSYCLPFLLPSHANIFKVVHVPSPHFLRCSLTFPNGVWSSVLLKLLLPRSPVTSTESSARATFLFPSSLTFQCTARSSSLKPSPLAATQTARWHLLRFSPTSPTPPPPSPLLAHPPSFPLYLLSLRLSPGPFSLFYSSPK